MDPITQQQALAAAGAAGDKALYVDDVFSTYVYEGNSTARSINNGIDLAGEGGLVWIKNRESSGADDHALHDTERGASDGYLEANSNDPKNTGNTTNGLTSFNNNGFSLGSDNYWNVNYTGTDIVSWTFRKCPGFFDIVTYTGNGSNPRTISHSLGSKPGMMWVKRTDSSAEWHVYHQSQGATKYGTLDENYAFASNSNRWNNTEPTSTQFTVDVQTNISGATYVAYLFAHDDQSFGENEDQSIIKCGGYYGNDGTQAIDLGFEPQWVLVKRASGGTGNWILKDSMRGMPSSSVGNLCLYPNLNIADNAAGYWKPSSTGFILEGNATDHNASGSEYIYVAIRRPHKPPVAGTDVFAIDTLGATSPTPPGWTAGFTVDWEFSKTTTNTSSFETITRLTNAKMYLDESYGENSVYGTSDSFDYNTGWSDSTGPNSNNHSWMFRRAPGFFDVVSYSGTGTTQNISHNLAAIPELMIQKRRSSAGGWNVYTSSLGSSKYIQLDGDYAENGAGSTWGNADPTASVFSIGGSSSAVNKVNNDYLVLLFATLPGISKVGSYSGTGNNIDVDCGFTAGARFVLIKRTDSSGDWYLYDSTRGIVSGNDPYLLVNVSNGSEVTGTDYIDPLNSGFTVTSSAPAALNTSGGNYVFLAIA